MLTTCNISSYRLLPAHETIVGTFIANSKCMNIGVSLADMLLSGASSAGCKAKSCGKKPFDFGVPAAGQPDSADNIPAAGRGPQNFQETLLRKAVQAHRRTNSDGAEADNGDEFAVSQPTSKADSGVLEAVLLSAITASTPDGIVNNAGIDSQPVIPENGHSAADAVFSENSLPENNYADSGSPVVSVVAPPQQTVDLTNKAGFQPAMEAISVNGSDEHFDGYEPKHTIPSAEMTKPNLSGMPAEPLPDSASSQKPVFQPTVTDLPSNSDIPSPQQNITADQNNQTVAVTGEQTAEIPKPLSPVLDEPQQQQDMQLGAQQPASTTTNPDESAIAAVTAQINKQLRSEQPSVEQPELQTAGEEKHLNKLSHHRLVNTATQQTETATVEKTQTNDGNQQELVLLKANDTARLGGLANKSNIGGQSGLQTESNIGIEQALSVDAGNNSPQDALHVSDLHPKMTDTAGDAENITSQMHQSIAGSIKDGSSEITIHLNPPQLGRVHIKFEQRDTGIVGVLNVERAETRAQIQQLLPAVIRNLQDSGIQLRRLDVNLSDNASQQSFDRDDSNAGGGDDWSGHNGYEQNAGGGNEQFHRWLTGTNSSGTMEQHQHISVADGSINMLV